MYGKRRATNVMFEELQKECLKFEEGLAKAGQSNDELHKAMRLHISNLHLLSGGLEELQKALPAFDVQRCKALPTRSSLND
jgi:tyrosine-protein phosphatase non-receptor type 23